MYFGALYFIHALLLMHLNRCETKRHHNCTALCLIAELYDTILSTVLCLRTILPFRAEVIRSNHDSLLFLSRMKLFRPGMEGIIIPLDPIWVLFGLKIKVKGDYMSYCSPFFDIRPTKPFDNAGEMLKCHPVLSYSYHGSQ